MILAAIIAGFMAVTFILMRESLRQRRFGESTGQQSTTDDTVVRAQRLGARVLQNPWTNHAVQMNWALQNGDIRSDWVMRLDADEFLDESEKLSMLT